MRLWNLKADNPAAVPLVLHGREDVVSIIGFSPGGQWLATRSEDKTVCLWPLPTERLIRIAGQVVGRNFSPEEWDEYLPSQPYHETFPGLPIPK